MTMHAQKIRAFVMPRSSMHQVTALLVVATIFGGGGSGAGIFNLIVQLSALGIIALNPREFIDFFKHAPRHFAYTVGATLLLPLLQSIPLPPLIWHSLPGRNLVVESFQIFNTQNSWFPISMNVRRTLIAFLSLIPPLAIIILTWKSSNTEKRKLLTLIVLAGVFQVLLGAQQLATGNSVSMLFSETLHSQSLQGTFANRNSIGIFLDIALCATIGMLPKGRPPAAWLLSGPALIGLFTVGIILTKSRSSMALAVIPFAVLIFRLLLSPSATNRKWSRLLVPIVGICLLTGAIVAIGTQNQRLQTSLMRFDDLQDVRPQIWADTLTSINRFWPIGSGIGTFDEVFQIDETLENLGPGRAGRAHNDYLEIILESGIFAIFFVIGWVALLIRYCWRAIRDGGYPIVSLCVLILLALQSIVDYPLRNQTILCVAALMLALLIPRPQKQATGERS